MYDTRIGARTRVIDGAILTGNMEIEEDVFIGPGVLTVNDNDVYLRRFGLAPWAVSGPRIRRFALVGTGANLVAGITVGVGRDRRPRRRRDARRARLDDRRRGAGAARAERGRGGPRRDPPALRMSRLSIVVPVYHNAASLPDLLARLPALAARHPRDTFDSSSSTTARRTTPSPCSSRCAACRAARCAS